MIKEYDCKLSNLCDNNTSNLLSRKITHLATKSLDHFLNRKGKISKADLSRQKRQRFYSRILNSRPSSKTFNILFNDTALSTQTKFKPPDCHSIISPDTLYNSKKTQLINALKQKNKKQRHQDDLGFLKTKPLSVFNFTESFFYEDLNLIKKKKNRTCLLESRAIRTRSEENKTEKVLVLRRQAIKEKQAVTEFFNTQEDPNIQIVALPEKSKEIITFSKKKSYLKKTCLAKFKAKTQCTEDYYPFKKQTVKKQPFIFGSYEKPAVIDTKNKQKWLLYHDFLWKLNFSNGLFFKVAERESSLKVYVGQGNNCNLIKSIIRRRHWWTLVQNHEICDFAWSQLKINSVLRGQKGSSKQIANKLQKINDNLSQLESFDDYHNKIFNSHDLARWRIHCQKNQHSELKISQQTYKNRSVFTQEKEIIKFDSSYKIKMHNHFQCNGYIGNKKALFYMMKRHFQGKGEDVFKFLPLTFHISKGLEDSEWRRFQNIFKQYEAKKMGGQKNSQNIWIIKPGECSNRGNGITMCYELEDIRLRLKSKERNSDGTLRTFIIQKYIEDPLLFYGRKFDLRHYLLVTCFNGIFKAYWYEEGYVRTSSSQFSLKRNTNLYVHLTNDAIQKNNQNYGKYQQGNKVSYEKLNKYIKKMKGADYQENKPFYKDILPKMKSIAREAVIATYRYIDPKRKQFNFQLFGMDFMIDQNFKPWLIEVNTNPCLQTNSSLLSQLIPNVIEHTFRICVDPLFLPPEQWPSGKPLWLPDNPLQKNKFELIFDQTIDGYDFNQTQGQKFDLTKHIGKVEEESQLFQNDGKQLQQHNQ